MVWLLSPLFSAYGRGLTSFNCYKEWCVTMNKRNILKSLGIHLSDPDRPRMRRGDILLMWSYYGGPTPHMASRLGEVLLSMLWELDGEEY